MPSLLNEDELLTETVRRFPALYDKTKKDYKDRNITKNAWNEVANLLDFVERFPVSLFLYYFLCILVSPIPICKHIY